MEKTNVARLLDASKIDYNLHEYEATITEGVVIAKLLNQDEEKVFKTLVTISNTKEHFVFCIPVNHTLNLKKAAKACNVKSIEMIKQKELLTLTGYVHGGCSPIGMKTKFKTFINDTAILFDTICVSAGRLGHQVEIEPNTLLKYVDATFVDLID